MFIKVDIFMYMRFHFYWDSLYIYEIYLFVYLVILLSDIAYAVGWLTTICWYAASTVNVLYVVEILFSVIHDYLLRLPVGHGGVVNSPRFCFFFHLSMSKVGLPLMGDTAGFFLLLSALLHII